MTETTKVIHSLS